MSELKTYYCNTIHNEHTEFYIKSEADKVIAEKDEKIDELEERIDEIQKATDSAWSKVNSMYDELRHQKYKRSLDKAARCGICAQFEHYKVIRFDNPFYLKRAKWLEKWRGRWIKIAEQFKEAK